MLYGQAGDIYQGRHQGAVVAGREKQDRRRKSVQQRGWSDLLAVYETAMQVEPS